MEQEVIYRSATTGFYYTFISGKYPYKIPKVLAMKIIKDLKLVPLTDINDCVFTNYYHPESERIKQLNLPF